MGKTNINFRGVTSTLEISLLFTSYEKKERD